MFYKNKSPKFLTKPLNISESNEKNGAKGIIIFFKCSMYYWTKHIQCNSSSNIKMDRVHIHVDVTFLDYVDSKFTLT